MALRFNKSVLINNPRLECLYLFFSSCMVIFLACKFVLGHEHLIFYEGDYNIHVSIEPQVAEGQAELQRIYDGQANTCAQLDGRCLPPCHSSDDWSVLDDSSFSCAFPQHLAFPLNGQLGDSLMFPTSITTQSLMVGNATTEYYPYEEAVGLRLRVSEGLSRISSTGTPDIRSICVTLLDHAGNIYRVVDDPSDAQELSLLALLEMSGFGRDYLDAEQAVEDDVLIGRDRGVRMDLVTDCYDEPSARGRQSSDVYQTFRRSNAQILCTVRAVAVEAKSSVVSGPFIAPMRHTIHGLTVSVAAGRHSMSRFSIVRVLDSLVQAAVYARIPKFLALMVTVHLLGHLSRIYKPVIYEVFDIAEQIAGTAARLTSNTVAFEELCEHEQCFISKETFLRRIKLANSRLAHLAEDELELFVDFSHKALLDLKNYSKLDRLTAEVKTDAKRLFNTEFDHIGRWWSLVRGMVPHHLNSARAVRRCTEVGVNEFTRGCSSNDKLHMMDAIHLFNRKRGVKWLERLFMPAYIRRFYATISVVDRIKCSVDLKRPDTTAAAEAAPESPRAAFDGVASEPLHSTQGAKAYNKILELELRHQSLENVAKDFVLSDHLSGHLRSQVETLERSMEEVHRRQKELEELFRAQIPRSDTRDSLVNIVDDEQADGGEASRDMPDDRETPSGLAVGPSRWGVMQAAEAISRMPASNSLPVLEPVDDSVRRAALRARFWTSTTPLSPLSMQCAALSTPEPERQAYEQNPRNAGVGVVALQGGHALT